ncbi:hypothetical protein ILYODFUR_028931 [Ilyodon furcidens]|uniref:Uncharacterized protein n=1 Tax=Ilyodon furcidens TaxID=33524 RepID=A0ABV0UL91_9TELE
MMLQLYRGDLNRFLPAASSQRRSSLLAFRKTPKTSLGHTGRPLLVVTGVHVECRWPPAATVPLQAAQVGWSIWWSQCLRDPLIYSGASLPGSFKDQSLVLKLQSQTRGIQFGSEQIVCFISDLQM